MNRLQHLQFQMVNLRHLLKDCDGDPILTPQLTERLEELEEELEDLKSSNGELFFTEFQPLPRAAVFLSGGGVSGQEGISPTLAGQALIQYEKMYVAQAMHDELSAARGRGKKQRPTGASKPELLFVGTPRGSFGFEFVPKPNSGAKDMNLHDQSLRQLAATLRKAAGLTDGDSLDDFLQGVPAKVVTPMKQFFKRLAAFNAELRLAFPDDSSMVIDREKIEKLTQRLERDVEQEDIPMQGVFRGVTLDSRDFNFLPKDRDEIIKGQISEEMTDEDIDRIHALTNKDGEVVLMKTTVRRAGGAESTSYVLQKARGENEEPFIEDQDD